MKKSNAEWLKEERQRLGLSQRELADKAQIPAGTIGGIERGAPLGMKTLKKLENYFAGTITGNNIQFCPSESRKEYKNKDVTIDELEKDIIIKIVKIATSPQFLENVKVVQETFNLDFDDSVAIAIDAMKKKGEFR